MSLSLHDGGRRPPLQQVEWELLPPQEKKERAKVASIFEWVALVMDRLIRIPGVKRRLGLNPILDLIPGVGDLGAALISVSVLVYAVRRGIPKILLGRMALNVLLNEIVGIIPVVGSVFAFWFCANTRNYDLLREHLDTPNRSTKGDKLFVSVIMGAVLLVIFGGLVATFLALYAFARLLSTH